VDYGISKVLVVGGGVIGQQIAAQMASKDVDVALCDVDSERIEAARRGVEGYVPGARVRYAASLEEGAAGADLVIESITEELSAKRRLFARLGTIFAGDARVILATNTSSLLPSSIARRMESPRRVCAYHFYSPMNGARVVDVMPHARTDADIPPRLVDFTRAIGLIPVLLRKEDREYVYNKLLIRVIDDSVEMVIKGVADYKEVDRSWMGNTRMDIGPFGMLDAIGLDTAMHVARGRARRNPLMLFAVRFFERYVSAGRLGLKSGEGFYRYPDPEFRSPGFLE
jgi:3-hydroxybutyryl-CoA dehydrogenase